MNFRRWILIFICFLNMGFIPGLEASDWGGVGVLFGILGLVYFVISFFSIPVGLAIMAVSMIFSPEIQVGAIGMREITIRIEDLLIPVLMLAWLAHAAVRRQARGFAPSPVNVPIFVLVLLSIFSTFLGYLKGWVDLVTALFYFGKTVEYFLIFYIVLNNVRTERQIRNFFFFAILTVTLLSLYTLTQVPSTQVFSSHRISAPFEGDAPQPSTVGGYMAFFLMIILSLFLHVKRKGLKWFYGILGVLTFIPFLYTFSRTSYAAFLGGLILLAILAKKRWLSFLIVGLLVLSPILLPRSVKERIAFTWEDSKNPGRNFGVDYSFQERLYSFVHTWDAIRRSPIYGMGISASHYVDNQYARSLQEVGLVGMGLWLWIFFRLFKMARWLYRYLEGGIFKGLALGYAAGILCILLHGFGSITFYVVRIMEPFWFISGLVVALYLLKVKEFSDVEMAKT